MGTLLVSGDAFFKDWSFDLRTCDVYRNDTLVATYQGLENHGKFFFKYGSDILPNDTIRMGSSQFTVRTVEEEYFNGTPDLISVKC